MATPRLPLRIRPPKTPSRGDVRLPPRTGAWGRAFLIGLSIAAATGCDRPQAPTPPVTPNAFTWQDLSAPDAGDCPILAGLLLALAAPHRTLGDETPRLHLAAGCGSPADGTPGTHVALALEFPHAKRPAEVFDGMALSGHALREDGPWQRMVSTTAAIGDALDVALARHRLARGDDDALTRTLGARDATDRQVLLTAIELAGDRRVRAAVPALIDLLAHPAPDIVLRAIGSLGRLGDPQALPALGTLAVSPRPQVWHTALRAMADIGGPRARQALELVALQAVDPAVIRMVQDLIREVEAR